MIADQYIGTNIQKLTEELSCLRDKYTSSAVDEFRKRVYELDTSDSAGLDAWGKVLSFPRCIFIPETGESRPLDDEEYRLILKLLAIQTKTRTTIFEINRYLKIIFEPFGAESYCQDSKDMTFVTYVFEFLIPDWLKYIFSKYDILPHPMGVGVRVVESLYGFIGFEGQELYNFYRPIFYFENEEEQI